MEESTKKYCPKCGAENSDSQKFCGSCGASFSETVTPVQNTGKKPVNVKVIIIAAAAVIAVAGTSVGIAVYNKPENKLERALAKDNYSLACDIYYQYSSDGSFKTVAKHTFKNYSENIVTRLAEGEITSDEVHDIIVGMDGVFDFSDVSEDVEALTLSKEAFAEAEKLKSDEDYVAAIEKYENVSEDDTENYDKVQEMISECKELYSSKVIADADEIVSKAEKVDDYKKALKLLDDAKDTGYINDLAEAKISEIETKRNNFVCEEAIKKAEKESSTVEGFRILSGINKDEYSDGFEKTLSEYQKKAEEEVSSKVKPHIDNKRYEAAINYIKGLPYSLTSSSDTVKKLKKEATESYVTDRLAEAKKYADKGSYSQAIEILEESKKVVDDSKFESKKKEYQKAADEHYIKSAQDYFVKKDYDSMNEYYIVNPYSTNYYEDYGSKYHIRPELYIKNNYFAFRLEMGYDRDYDYSVSMDKITISVDGRKFYFDVDYFDKDTDYHRGDYSEIWLAVHSTSSSQLKDDQYYDMTEMMKKMENAKEVIIRFSGSKYYVDYTLPQSEINKIVVYWKVYNILERNPELKKYVIG